MKKVLMVATIAVFSTFLFSSIIHAGKQELTKDNIKKAWAKHATLGDFCKIKTTQDDIKAFSSSISVGGNADDDKFLYNLGSLPCTDELEKIIYGTLIVQRVGMEAPDESLEQVFVIDDYIVRPVQYYNDFYNPGENVNVNESGPVYGAVKGIRSTRASLTSPVEGTGLDAGYYAHLDQSGIIDGLYVLYKNGLYKFIESKKEITDLILVDYSANAVQSPSAMDQSATPTTNPNQIACTQDVKECPDGSYVARQPPTCEFAPCP